MGWPVTKWDSGEQMGAFRPGNACEELGSCDFDLEKSMTKLDGSKTG